MTRHELVSRLNHILGRIEGHADGVESSQIGESMLDTAEMLACIIEELDEEVKPEL